MVLLLSWRKCFSLVYCLKLKWFSISTVHSIRILATVVLNTDYIIHTFLNSHNFTLFVENRLWKNTSLTFSLLSLHAYLLSVSICNSIFIPRFVVFSNLFSIFCSSSVPHYIVFLLPSCFGKALQINFCTSSYHLLASVSPSNVFFSHCLCFYFHFSPFSCSLPISEFPFYSPELH